MRSELLHTVLVPLLAGQPAIAPPPPSAPEPPPTVSSPPTAPEPEPEPEAPPPSSTEATPPPSGEEPATASEPAAPVDELADARARFARAAEHYQLGRYAEAVAIFEALYRETREAPLLFNLGQAHWKHYNLDPDVRHLRAARAMFENYDRAMVGQPGYDGREAHGYIRALQAQIGGIEASQGASLQPRGPDPRLLELDRKRHVARGMATTGVTLTVLGSLSAILGLVGGSIRISAGLSLENAGGGDAGARNPNSAEDDRRLRDTYLTGGQLAFAGVVGAAVLLPVGVALLVTGRVRGKRLASRRLAWRAGAGSIDLRF